MSNETKVHHCFLWVLVNQSVTAEVLFHMLSCSFFRMAVRMLSRIDLETMPISLFAGLISRQGSVLVKLSLWSFKVTYASHLAMHSILLSISRVCAMCCASRLMSS